MIYQTLGLIAKIFYSLNYQDLPEFFEDNIKIWMEGFYQLLVAPNIAALESDSDDQGAGFLENLPYSESLGVKSRI